MTILFWIVGWLFTLGVYVDSAKKGSAWSEIMEGFLLLLFWPTALGLVVADLIEVMKKEGD